MTAKTSALALLSAVLIAPSAQAGAFAEQAYTTPLADICPNPLILQKDWLAQAEHGGFVQLIGSGGDMSPGVYRGPLGSTGIDLMILEGGSGIGLGDGETSYSALFMGNSKAGVLPHLGYQELDNSVIFSKRFPTVGVFAPLDISPSALLWDAATYPEGFHSIDDLKAFAASDAGKIYVSTIKRTFGKFLVDQGIDADVFVEGYRGDGENFVVNNGTWLNQGFVTSEVYKFENGNNWAKPIGFVKINDLGYVNYTGIVSVAADKLDDLAPCLSAVVPLMQQAAVDYATDPDEANAVITAFNDAGNGTSWWKTEAALMDYATKTMVDEAIVGNGSNDTIGDFDMDRVQIIFDFLAGSLDERANPDATPEMVITNRFIDPTIGLK
ncbi:hypothetical protein [Pseudoruegeria sp. SK021]|uniref:hypothetical protein n=1 Tax=Pseudoruegeria sp. SK021 TaxID=1933035 RepID=UPI000A239FF2|nr:hypothetical protein [Pseudoruegeria sp. SK021]OSP55839.1 hypothetical protein BV911_05565 [Pseudoruegeria sp. SK021]